MLKPTHKNVVMGTILKDSDGKGARQLIAKHRIDMIDGNIGSYSRLLNLTAQMEMIWDVNALSATVAAISKDRADERTQVKDTADQKAKKREEKQKATELAEEAQQNEVMPFLTRGWCSASRLTTMTEILTESKHWMQTETFSNFISVSDIRECQQWKARPCHWSHKSVDYCKRWTTRSGSLAC